MASTATAPPEFSRKVPLAYLSPEDQSVIDQTVNAYMVLQEILRAGRVITVHQPGAILSYRRIPSKEE